MTLNESIRCAHSAVSPSAGDIKWGVLSQDYRQGHPSFVLSASRLLNCLQVCVRIWIYMYIHIHICIHICIYSNTYIHIYMCVCVYNRKVHPSIVPSAPRLLNCLQVCVCIRIYIYIYLYMYVCIYIYICIY